MEFHMRISVVVLALLLTAIIPIQEICANSLTLEITISKDRCYTEEPFWIDVFLINTSKDTLEVPYPAPEEGLLHFDGSFRSLPLEYEGLSISSIKVPIVTIPPGDTVFRAYNFWKIFLQDMQNDRPPDTGHVTLKAIYGSLESQNEISFYIDKPTGSHSEAFKLLRKYEGSFYEYPTPSFEERLSYLEQIADRYPHTGYAEEAVWLLTLFGGSDSSPRRQMYAAMMIEDYPSSGYVLKCLRKYLLKFDDSKKDSELTSLLSPDKPSRMRLIVTSWIKGYVYPQ